MFKRDRLLDVREPKDWLGLIGPQPVLYRQPYGDDGTFIIFEEDPEFRDVEPWLHEDGLLDANPAE